MLFSAANYMENVTVLHFETRETFEGTRSAAVCAQHTSRSTHDGRLFFVFSGVGRALLAAAAGPAQSGTQPRSVTRDGKAPVDNCSRGGNNPGRESAS